RAGRSPFTADRNHLHHRLLTLGFAHREAVLLIYILQVGLVLLAYVLRFELDSQILLAFLVFAALVLGSLRWATRSHWRVAHVQYLDRFRTQLNSFQPATPAPALSVGGMTTCLTVYAATVLGSSDHVGMDLGLLWFALLMVFLFLCSWRSERSLSWFERAAAYVSVVLLVYLDQTMHHKPPLLTALSWTFIGITGAAALLRFWLSASHRFEVTTLDLIVIFIGIVLPNLPGSIVLPA